jgi:hypothetical protein
MDGYADDSVRVGIEVGPPAKGLGGNRAFLDVLGAAGEALLADELQYARQIA